MSVEQCGGGTLALAARYNGKPALNKPAELSSFNGDLLSCPLCGGVDQFEPLNRGEDQGGRDAGGEC